MIARKPPLPSTPFRWTVRVTAAVAGAWATNFLIERGGSPGGASVVGGGGCWFIGEFIIEAVEMVRELFARRGRLRAMPGQQGADESFAPPRIVYAGQRAEPRNALGRGERPR